MEKGRGGKHCMYIIIAGCEIRTPGETRNLVFFLFIDTSVELDVKMLWLIGITIVETRLVMPMPRKLMIYVNLLQRMLVV